MAFKYKLAPSQRHHNRSRQRLTCFGKLSPELREARAEYLRQQRAHKKWLKLWGADAALDMLEFQELEIAMGKTELRIAALEAERRQTCGCCRNQR